MLNFKKSHIRIISALLTVIFVLTLLPIGQTTFSEPPKTYPTPPGFSDNDYQKLVDFALQDDNLSKLGWNFEEPQNWEGITWNDEAEKRVARIELRSLNLTGNLDISNYTALEYLQLSQNQLSNLDTSNNIALKSAFLNFNSFTSLDFSNNTALTRLDVQGNTKLTNLDISSSTTLTVLHVRFNHLVNLDVSNSTALTILDVGYNQLTNLDISNNTALTDLRADSNRLTNLNVSNNIDLTILRADSNRLKNLDVSNNINLTSLQADFNLLTSISSLENLNDLDFVKLNHNNLDLDNAEIQRSINIIQNNIRKNDGKFIYTPQLQPPTAQEKIIHIFKLLLSHFENLQSN
ncbi:MAG: hypothetical protein FWG90_13925 [Oscillospiraceae bacterium]|nr:hypothetical protein [Oscillospiraceae bacterium]